MKILVHDQYPVFGMANLIPRKTGLSVNIWSEHSGILRNVEHNEPRVKIGTYDESVSVSIEKNPRILTKDPHIKHSVMKGIKEAVQYVGRNYDLFLKHYSDTTDDFDDEDLFNSLRSRHQLV